MTQAPETPLTWRAWKQIAAMRVQERDLPGAARAYREAERRAPESERAGDRLAPGLAEQGDGRHGRRRPLLPAVEDAAGLADPYVTWAILAVTVVIGVAGLVSAELATSSSSGTPRAVQARGRGGRAVAPGHRGPGPRRPARTSPSTCTRCSSSGRSWSSCTATPASCSSTCCAPAGGSIASYVFNPASLSVGASGAVFGLFGMLLVADRVHKPALDAERAQPDDPDRRPDRDQPGHRVRRRRTIDNAAHIGGLLAGAFLGLVMVPSGATLALVLDERGGLRARLQGCSRGSAGWWAPWSWWRWWRSGWPWGRSGCF